MAQRFYDKKLKFHSSKLHSDCVCIYKNIFYFSFKVSCLCKALKMWWTSKYINSAFSGSTRVLRSGLQIFRQIVGTFVWSFGYLERLISISNVGSFKFEYICLIPQLMLHQQGMATTGYWRGITLILRSASGGD